MYFGTNFLVKVKQKNKTRLQILFINLKSKKNLFGMISYSHQFILIIYVKLFIFYVKKI